MGSELQLKRFFNHVNRKYFEGKLPNASIFFAPVSGEYGNVDLENGEFVIRINPSEEGRPKSWKFAVYHEAAHLKVWPNKYHGKVFDNEMLRLATMGAFRGIW